MERIFEWDSEKANMNYHKHGIQFEEAALVFTDVLAISRQDDWYGCRLFNTFSSAHGSL
jgi:uncharacterized DUF497 family protein